MVAKGPKIPDSLMDFVFYYYKYRAIEEAVSKRGQLLRLHHKTQIAGRIEIHRHLADLRIRRRLANHQRVG